MTITAAIKPATAIPENGATKLAPLPGAGVTVGVDVGTAVGISEAPPVVSEAPPVVAVRFAPTTELTLLKIEDREETISLIGPVVVGRAFVAVQSVPVTVSVTQTVSSWAAAKEAARERTAIDVNRIFNCVIMDLCLRIFRRGV